MILYHGSTEIVNPPIFGKGKTTNDYGRGFYCTQDIELAKEWACSRSSDGHANIYEFDTTGLAILDLNSPQHGILTWLAILAHYRSYWESGSISRQAKDYLEEHFFISPEEYDVVRGYRADDSYFTFAKNFVSNGISLSQLKRAMHLGALGEQVVLKSKQAFEQIEYQGNIPAKASIYAAQALARDRDARQMYRRMSKESSFTGDLYMLDILREEMKADDPRLR